MSTSQPQVTIGAQLSEPHRSADDALDGATTRNRSEATSSTARPKEQPVDVVAPLLKKICVAQKQIDKQEGRVLSSHITMGQLLADLRPLAKKTWAKQLDVIEMSPRVASRYVKLGDSWFGRIGLSESDSTRLPVDLMKLEWLCRVPQDQLSGLLDKIDCKKATRSEVIAAVRDALGETKPTRTVSAVQVVERLLRRLLNTVRELGHQDLAVMDQVRHALAAGLQDLAASTSLKEEDEIDTSRRAAHPEAVLAAT